ncbi:MAG TPA: hypothetical protein VL463_02895 [Kofleriaceae bacterium]|nr:hypothetical protein [Kofleriaceae bacterium]
MRAALVACVLVACTGVPADPGRDADLLIAGAQFYRGAPPGDQGGPAVTGLETLTTDAYPGQTAKSIGGTADATSREIAYYLDGDVGYWMIPTGLEDPTNPALLDFAAKVDFAPTIDDGPRTLHVQATDASGTFGPPSDLELHVKPLTIAQSTLDVRLTWDTDADVDLHVTLPGGVTVWSGNINSYVAPPPGQPPGDPSTGGVLDVDSNASCAIDGRDEENVYWTAPPPSGHYVVRVDTWGLCGQTAARWHVAATLGDTLLGQAHGEAVDSDTRFTKQANAGVLALEFDVP